MKIYQKIVIGLIAGVIFGVILGELAQAFPAAVNLVKDFLDPIGKGFLRLLKMVIVPLVFCSICLGVASLGGDLKKLGRMGIKTVAFFVITTLLAVAVGIGLSHVVQPGKVMDPATMERLKAEGAAKAQKFTDNALAKKVPGVAQFLLRIIPDNPLQSMTEGDMLQVIFFAFFLGIALTYLPDAKRRGICDILDWINESMVACVKMIMKAAPYGVFALIAGVIARFGASILILLARYTMVVVLGQIILVVVFDLGAVLLIAKVSPVRFIRGIKDAMLVAFSMSSSSAALPITMESCQKNLGISQQVTSFVTSLGATVNMNGTALYQGVAAMFIAQVYGIDLTIGQQFLIVIMATLASVGTAGVPGVGMITLVMVLRQVNVPAEGVALIMGVDRLLDMVRSMVNMTGDCACAVIVAKGEGETLLLDKPE